MDTDRRKEAEEEEAQWHSSFHFSAEEASMADTPQTTTTENDTNNRESTPITTTTTTTTATATLEKYNLTVTKTFDPKQEQQAAAAAANPNAASSGSGSDSGSFFETRTTLLMEQMASLHGQLGHMLPTRSYYSASSVPPSTHSENSILSSSCSSSLSSHSLLQHQTHHHAIATAATTTTTATQQTALEWEDGVKSLDGFTSTTSQSGGGSEVVLLHPLQAAPEDMQLYEANLTIVRTQMSLITDGMEWIQQELQQRQLESSAKDMIMATTTSTTTTTTTTTTMTETTAETAMVLSPDNDHSQIARLSQIDQAYNALRYRMEQAERQHKAFRQGFDFSQACHAIRVALDTVQANMMQQKNVSAHQTVVQAWEESITTTTQRLTQLQIEALPQLSDDELYQKRWSKMKEKNELVKTWVEEVRVWFAEAERIRQWIDERRDQLEETTLPDPFLFINEDDTTKSTKDGSVFALEKVRRWQEQHQVLEKDMETFDQQDMARLRSHVKALTGGKDLSPADTTTIEITLTTLTTLDKVMHTLRDKSHRLHLLTQRALWEAEYEKTMAWLHATENQVDAFLSQARWTPPSQDASTSTTLAVTNMDKSTLIDGLLSLEHKLSDFDKTGFTNTVNLFQDFDDAAQEDLPAHLEQRQANCEQFFEDLFKRMAFVRSVVEQRLAMIDFMDLVQHVHIDAQQLQSDLKHNCSFVSISGTKRILPTIMEKDGEDDFSNNDGQHAVEQTEEEEEEEEEEEDEGVWADKVQIMQERIIPLASTQRIPYPVATLTVDKQDNEVANQMIRQHVSHHRTQLVLLGETVDRQWQALRQRWQLRQRMLALIAEAEQWKAWADERIRMIQHNEQQLCPEVTLDQISHLERALVVMKTKLGTKESQINGFFNKKVKGLVTAIHDLVSEESKEQEEDVQKQWQEQSTLELDVAAQHMQRMYDTLKQQMADHARALEEWRRRLEQGNNAVDRRNELMQFIHSVRILLPGIKQTCGFMTGQSQQQDENRFTTLSATWNKLKQDVAERQSLFDDLRQEENSTIDAHHASNSEDVGDAGTDNLVKQWALMIDELNQLAVFQDTVRQWYDRQRRLSLVEQTLDNVSVADEDTDSIIQLGQEQQQVLLPIGEEIVQAADTRDPLQTANYSCAKDRHQALVARTEQMVKDAKARQQEQQNRTAQEHYQQEVDQLVNTILADCDAIRARVLQHRSQQWSLVLTQQANSLAALIRTANHAIEAQQAQKQQHCRYWDHLRSLAPSSLSPLPSHEMDERVQAALQELDEAINLEKQQYLSLRHLHVHAKAANDLQLWLMQCNTALTQLSNDIGVVDEAEIRATIGRFEAKLDGMQPTLTGFQRIHDKVIAMLDKDFIDAGDVSDNSDDNQRKSKIEAIYRELHQGFQQVGKQLNDIATASDHHRQHVGIARKMKDLLYMIGGYRDNVAAIRIQGDHSRGEEDKPYDWQQQQQLQQEQQQQQQQQKQQPQESLHGDESGTMTTDCLSPWLMQCPLSMIPTERAIRVTKDQLDRLEQDIRQHIDGAICELDDALSLLTDDKMFTDQRKEITQAIAGLNQGIQDKRHWLAEATKLEVVLTILDEWEVLLSALNEVVERAKICSTSDVIDDDDNGDNGTLPTGTSTSYRRADLQAMLIDLDTRYRYYEPNIQSLVKEAQLVIMQSEQDPRLVAYYDQLTQQWQQLQELAKARKEILLSKIGPLADPLTLSSLQDALPGGHHRYRQSPQRPMSTMSSITTTVSRTTTPQHVVARKSSYQKLTTATLPPSSARRPMRAVTPSAFNGTNGLPPRLMTAERAKKRSSWREQKPSSDFAAMARRSMSPFDAYVADPKNDLDVAVGNIVNDSPYAIKVKMVPGEVGRYWFGKKNPKLAYCRILRSRMVMVRVGGGWVELSQFLRDHALLEEGRFTSAVSQRTLTVAPASISTGDKENTDEAKKKKRYSQPLTANTHFDDQQQQRGLRHSRSTPFQPSSYLCYSTRGQSPISPGIKAGNKFLVTDDDGKQVQVHMTKARSKQTSSFRTPWR